MLRIDRFIWLVARYWGRLERGFPAKPARDDAVVRPYQSFRLGVVNLGFSIRVAVDDRHLHLEPTGPLRWLGARSASIPWEAITVKRRSMSGKWMTVEVSGRRLQGPAWCLGLAEPAVAADGGA